LPVTSSWAALGTAREDAPGITLFIESSCTKEDALIFAADALTTEKFRDLGR